MRDPFAHEDIGGSAVPLIAIDLYGTRPEDGTDLVKALAAIPAVTVGIADLIPSDPSGRALRDAFDILISTDTAVAESGAGGWVAFKDRDITSLLDQIVTAVEGSPLASVTLAQLLRLTERSTVRDALMAESLAYATLQSNPRFRTWLGARRSTTTAPRTGPVVRVDRNDGELQIVLDQPDRHNAFSARMRDELVTALRVAAADSSITSVTLRGEGASFSAGGDLDEFGAVPDSATGHHIRSIRSPAWWMHELSATTTVHVHGACIGAGIELPAFSHRIVAETTAFFQLPEVAMGLIPGAGGTVSIPRRIGRQRTAWLAITAARIDSRRALQWELVDGLRKE